MPPSQGTASLELAEELIDLTLEDDNKHIPTFDLSGLDDDDELEEEAVRHPTPKQRTASSASIRLDCYVASFGEKLETGTVVELQDGNFLRISFIEKNRDTGIISLTGNLLRRNARVDSVPRGWNEVCLILQAPPATRNGDPRIEDCLVTRTMDDYVCIREVFFTNEKYPALSYRVHNQRNYRGREDIYERAQLVCRYRYTEELVSNSGKVYAGSIMRLRDHECDALRRCNDIIVLRSFLDDRDENPEPAMSGRPTPSTKADGIEQSISGDVSNIRTRKRRLEDHGTRNTVDLTNDDEEVFTTVHRMQASPKRPRTCQDEIRGDVKSETKASPCIKRYFGPKKSDDRRTSHGSVTSRAVNPRQETTYTFGDLFAGAGGVASGAKQAGLEVSYLLDHWGDASDTQEKNFIKAKVIRKSIFDFCTNKRRYRWERVDILHISFPCQPHSPAHTVACKRDADNIAAAYSVANIFKRCKPRIVTFEQTSGIVTHNGGHHFRALKSQILDQGYSLRWQVTNLAEHGNAQPRKRLIIIAACPGEILPRHPEPTHGVGRGKKPFVTIRDVLRTLRNHNTPQHMLVHTPKNEEAYDDRVQLSGAITCGGGAANLHPSGLRSFNLQELAALQGFPPDHQFVGNTTNIKKQIGNAVPSVFAKQLYQHIIRSLRESDRKNAAWRPPTIALDD